MRALDERHTPAALDGQQGELGDQVADAPDVLAADGDLLARAPGRKPMQVRMVAVLHEPAAPALAARTVTAGRADTQEPGREVEPERRLAHRGWPREEHRVG